MRIISHRGNMYGPDPYTENKPHQILSAVMRGYDVEIDLWLIGNILLLGHDEPTYEITLGWLHALNKYLWIHCKNITALNLVKNEFNSFGHDRDDYILTSSGFIWIYPNKPLVSEGIAVLPELSNYTKNDLLQCYSVCTDFAYKYKNELC